MIDCALCGQQALGLRTTNHGRPRCFGCQAAQQVDAALTGRDGTIRPELTGVRDALTELKQPRCLLSNWQGLASLHLLTDIAQGRLDLSHDALDAMPQVFSVIYLRAMLVAAGARPPRDENAARRHRYATETVADITDPELRGVLARYARWHVAGRAKTDRHGHITDDIKVRDEGTYLALGTEPLLLIPPLDALITALPVAKPFGTASSLADTRWLFTGKNAGTHLHPASLMARITDSGSSAAPGETPPCCTWHRPPRQPCSPRSSASASAP